MTKTNETISHFKSIVYLIWIVPYHPILHVSPWILNYTDLPQHSSFVLEPISHGNHITRKKSLPTFFKLQNSSLGTRLVSGYIFEYGNSHLPILIRRWNCGLDPPFCGPSVSYNCRGDFNYFRFTSAIFSQRKKF